MKASNKASVKKIIFMLAIVFLMCTSVFLLLASQFVKKEFQTKNEQTAIDYALMTKRFFTMTDEEVSYMKSLTFNEMEKDAINHRLMDHGNSADLSVKIVNIYIIAPLEAGKTRACETEEQADLIGFEKGTVLDGIWLLNGIFDDEGIFIEKQRDDICRYTKLTESEKSAIQNQKTFGEVSNDEWGTFISGYSPIYTVEGNLIGLLGIDMELDKYQKSVTVTLTCIFITAIATCTLLLILFLIFYFKYTKVNENRLTEEILNISEREIFTGLYNKNYMQKKYEMKKERYLDKPVIMALLDIDHFKKVNDTYGHDMGDRVISEVSKSLEECVPSHIGIAARYGGDEFGIVFEGQDMHTYRIVIQEIKDSICAKEFDYEGTKFHVTISSGLDDVSDTPDFASAIHKLDLQLYQEKRR